MKRWLLLLLVTGFSPGVLPGLGAASVIRPTDDLAAGIRAARTQSRPARLELAGGTYELQAPLKLAVEDSGLVLAAAAGKSARLVGSSVITGWTLTDPQRRLWTAPVPRAFGRIQHVFVNGERWQRCRTPDTGWLETTEKLPVTQPFTMTIPLSVFRTNWAERGDVYVRGLQKWAGFAFPVQKVDPSTHTVTLAGPLLAHRQERTNRFWIENTPEALDADREWYHDTAAATLQIIAPAGVPLDKARVSAGRLSKLLVLEGCQDVVVRGITFAEAGDDFPVEKGEMDAQAAVARRGAIQCLKSERCAFEDCVVENVGGYAFDLGRGSRACRLSRCTVRFLGAGGIRMGETRAETETAAQAGGHLIEDCRVHSFGRLYPGGCGILILQSAQNVVRHNEIFDAPYTGVSVGWTWGYKDSPCRENLVESNHIHHLGGKLLSDLGGVYLLGPQPGTVVRGNYIHDLDCFDYGAWGLYTDEGSTHMTLENNVVIRCARAGFHQHYGRENTIANNLIAFCGEGGVRRTREETHLSFTFKRNLVINEKPQFLHSSFKNGSFAFERNLYFSPNGGSATWAGKTWEQWPASGQDSGSLVADPQLIDPAHPEKGLRPGTPADGIGFVMPDVTRAGPRHRSPSRTE